MTSIAHGTPSRGTARITLLGRASRLAAPVLLLLAIASVLTGCSANFNPQLTGADPSPAVGSLKGNVHGGQAPIYGAAIYVMQTGLSGYPLTINSGPTYVYAAANTSLISSSSGTFTGTVNGTSHGTYVLTDTNGNFTIPGFTCTPGAGVYIYSVGGQPIYGTPNNAATEMAAMGICPAGGASALAASVPFVNVNEVSTVAMAYALEGFTEAGLDATHISSSSTNTTGLANAFGTAAALYTVSTNNGANTSISGQPGSTVITYQAINTLADILSDCINSNGSTSSSSTPCYTLFQNATSNGASGGGTVPTDTASAIINISHWPQSNVSSLYALASNGYSPYTPIYGALPANFTVGIYYQSGYTEEPQLLEIDSAGYVYSASYLSSTGTALHGFAKISPYSGFVAASSPTSPVVDRFAIDTSNNIFTINFTSPTITEYAASTTALLGSQVGSYSLSTGTSVGNYLSIGSSNNLLFSVTPTSGGAYMINVPLSSGTYNLNAPAYTYGPTGLSNPYGALQTAGGQIYISDYGSNYFDVENGSTQTKYSFSTTTDTSDGLTQDYHQSPIVSSSSGNSFYYYAPLSSPTRYTGGGLSTPLIPDSDGENVFFFPNNTACTISIYSFSLHNSQTVGWIYPSGLYDIGCGQNSNGVGGLWNVAIDQSGNAWTGIFEESTTINGSTGNYPQQGKIFEIIGLAAPLTNPVSAREALGGTGNYDLRP